MEYRVDYGFTGSAKAEHTGTFTRFTALENDMDASYWVDLFIHAPISDTYIMIPACAYDGNRIEAVRRKYPPMFNEDEFGLNASPRMTQVPRLSKTGDSFMDITTGDMAAPCVCILDKSSEQGIIIVFDQGQHGLNHGVSLDQTGDELRIRLRAPAARRLVYRWFEGCPSLEPLPDADPALSVNKGDTTVIPHLIHTFPCKDISSLYHEFFKLRAEISSGKTPANMPFSHYWKLAENLADGCFIPGENFYSLLSLGDSINLQWQAGWVGGGMYTLPLICEGSEVQLNRSLQTLEFASRCQSPTGWYYGCFHKGKIYHDCFRHYIEKYSMLLVRKHADLTYFMWKQIYILRKKSINIPTSVFNSAINAVEAIISLWKKYGQLGQFINADTGEILVGGSSSGAMAPAALCAAYKVTSDTRYLSFAREIAEFYYNNHSVVGLTTGGPGEILQAPDSESAAALLESYISLYECDSSSKWLSYAEDAAAQLSSWVVCYDYDFPHESKFGKLDIHTNGSVWANVQNKHSAPGLCTISPAALMKLYRATGNTAYMDLMRDIARFMPQTASCPERPIYKTDGEPMAPGEICERVNLSDWEGREGVGDSIFGGCTWPEVSLMLTWLEIPGVYVDTDHRQIWASDHVDALFDGNNIIISNPTSFDAEIKLMVESSAEKSSMLGLYWQEKMRRISVPAGKSISVEI